MDSEVGSEAEVEERDGAGKTTHGETHKYRPPILHHNPNQQSLNPNPQTTHPQAQAKPPLPPSAATAKQPAASANPNSQQPSSSKKWLPSPSKMPL
jgi:hypothetical protein